MRISLIVLLACTLTSVAQGQSQAKAANDDPERRLLRAELLEISTGDLEKAMAIYRAIEADEKTPEPTRARALLYLARCHRKLGGLEEAQKLLNDILQHHSKHKDILRQARSFLRELRSGKAENPKFDWLGELQKNPEVQARVFDLAMELVKSRGSSMWHPAPHDQLLALGALAVPVLEQLVEASRKPGHRQHLAVILLHSGQFDRLQMLFAGGETPGSAARYALAGFLQSVESMDAEERKRLLEAIDKVPDSVKTRPWLDALRLAAGDTKGLAAKIRAVEGLDEQGEGHTMLLKAHGVLARLIEDDQAVAPVFAEILLDRNLPVDRRFRYYRLLQEHAPQAVTGKHIVALLTDWDPGRTADELLEPLERLGKVKLLVGLMESPLGRGLAQQYFSSTYVARSKIGEAPTDWAPVLRAIAGLQHLQWLHRLAEVQDDAIEEFVGFLRARDTEGPEYLTYGPRQDQAWQPSAAYAAAMAGLLEEKDPVAVAIALEALALAPAGVGPEVLPVLEKLALEPPDPYLAGFAIHALLRRFATRPETGPRVAKTIIECWRRQEEEPVDSEASPSPLQKIGPLGVTRPRFDSRSSRSLRMQPRGRSGYGASLDVLSWAYGNVAETIWLGLLPHLLEQGNSEVGGRFLALHFRQLGSPEAQKIFLAHIDSFKDSRARAALLERQRELKFLVDSPKGLELLRSVAIDTDLPVERRALAVYLAWDESTEWFEWTEFLKSDDPLAQDFVLGNLLQKLFKGWLQQLPSKELEALLGVMLQSPLEPVGVFALSLYPGGSPGAKRFYEQAMANRNLEVQKYGVRRLLNRNNVDAIPILIKLLKNPQRQELRNDLLKQITTFLTKSADPSAIEPLRSLLDNPDVSIRNMAFEAIKKIKAAIEEKEALKKS